MVYGVCTALFCLRTFTAVYTGPCSLVARELFVVAASLRLKRFAPRFLSPVKQGKLLVQPTNLAGLVSSDLSTLQ